ncbi:MAG: hypothetical protein CMH63_00295 [Nanoarchaeota archaeon]|jgi:hypothetical protein|nr:hypothetical protein [Nanoarchaeota archaeon]|tara:strand:+ start:15935 stop:17536 length:1602 start_codon:yes stop_codon:yes gene_type:complete
MTKTIPLVFANLKEFIRNWKSITLILLLPILIITLFFASFSTAGLQKIPIGIINTADTEIVELTDSLSEILVTKNFENLENCLRELKQYKQYMCIDITRDRVFRLNAHYDNTQTLVIWGVINYLQSTVEHIKKQKTIEVTSKILKHAESGPQHLEKLRSNLGTADSILSSQMNNLENSRNSIERSISTIGFNLDALNSPLSNMENQVNSLQLSSEDPFINSVAVNILSNINSIKTKKNYAESAADDLDSETNELNFILNNLRANQRSLKELERNLNALDVYLNQIQQINPEEIADPIKLDFQPTYLPELNQKILTRFKNRGEGEITQLIKGETLLSFQVIFPKILLLIVMFIAILTSSFVCLNHIKSPANFRMKTIKGMFIPSFFSVYLASFIITLVPIFIVVLLGNFLFLLPFLENLGIVLLILFMTLSVKILLGMSTAYLIKEKSLTLLVSIFLLLFLLFFSGFILPIERMGTVPAKIASNFPGNLASDALGKILFYDQHFYHLREELVYLSILLVTIFLFTFFIKKMRNS